jgi:hypothetical protein
MDELRATMKSVMREQGNRFPEWVLDRIGTEVMFANRIAMDQDSRRRAFAGYHTSTR